MPPPDNAPPRRSLKDHAVQMLRTLQEIFLRPETELRDSDILLRSILDSATEYAIIATDPDRTIITWNTGAERIFGWTKEEVVGKKNLSFLIPEEETKSEAHKRSIRDQIATKGLWMGEALRRRKNGETFHARIVVTPLRSRHRHVIGSIAIIRDISREVALRRQIEETARQLEAKVAERTRELEKSNRLMTQELEYARLLQRAMLKNSVREIPRYKYFYKYLPSKGIGGDFFTVRQLDEHRYYFYISDVSGHGVPAAMLTVYAHQTVRNLLTVEADRPQTPSQLLARLNRAFLREQFPGSPFLTVLFCFLDLRTDTLTYASAGHPPGILYNNTTGRTLTFGTHGRPIGVTETARYEDGLLRLEPSDNLFLYTDGLTEIFDRQGHRVFDTNALLEFIARRASHSESGTVKALLNHIRSLTGQGAFDDDIAILNIKRVR